MTMFFPTHYLGVFAPLAIIGFAVQRLLLSATAKVPGPWYAKMSVLPKKYHDLTGTTPSWIYSLHLRYGAVVCVAPDIVDTCSPVDAQQIHGFKRPFLKTSFYEGLGPGQVNVFSTRNVEQHRRYRKLLSGPLSETSLKVVVPRVVAKVHLVLHRMRDEMANRGAVDVARWFTSFTTDVISELTFGESFQTLESGEINQYMRDLQAVAKNFGIRSVFPFFGYVPTYLIPIPAIRDAFAYLDRNKGYAEAAMQRQRDLLESDDDAVAKRPTLFTKVLRAEDDEVMTHTEARLNAQAYIVAGSDTTAMTLTYLTWAVCLPEHAHMKRKLLDELATLETPAGGDGDHDADDNGAAFDDEQLKKLPYLGMLITEALRLYSAVPGALPRTVPAGGVELVGDGDSSSSSSSSNDGKRYFLPAGTTVQTAAYTLHRNAAVFGPDPEKFRPERWAEDKTTRAMRDAFMPFGGGARACIGLHLAHMELRIAVAAFFRAFPRAEVSDREGFGRRDMEPKMFFLMNPSGHRCLINAH